MTPGTVQRPWEGLEPALATLLRPELPALADETILAISEGVTEYARPLEGRFGRDLRAGVEEAFRQFLELIERPGIGRSMGREVYVALGRAEMRAGRGLDVLLSAYRIGARVAWRRFSAAALAAEVPAATLSLLAESIFAYIDELSAESVEGYADEQSLQAGEVERRRRRLIGLLVRTPAPDPEAVAAAALEAGWELPRRVAAVALPESEPGRWAGRLGVEVLAGSVGGTLCLLVPDPDAPGRRGQLESALTRVPATLGPTVSWAEAGRSFARASAALRLCLDGVLPAVGLVPAEEHLTALLLVGDPGLTRELSMRCLAPLEGLGPEARARASDTLRAWLSHHGRLREVAAALDVHPQTARYRMTRLRERFGDALDDPDRRFELEAALRAEALGAGGAAPGPSVEIPSP